MSSESNRSVCIAFSTSSLVLSWIIPFLFKFLKSNTTRLESLRKNHFLNVLAKKVYELESTNEDVNLKLAKYIDENISIKEIEDTVYNKTLSSLEADLIEKISKNYEKAINPEIRQKKIATYLHPLESNIEKYIDKLQNNSIINLMIGIIGTTISITLLSFILFSNKEFKDVSQFLIFFLPRLTFVVSIQLFAFFFLRLYKNNLEDVKYFQNELTNIVSKTSSLKIAAAFDDKSKVNDLIDKLSNVERNFILHKDDTLLNIEKAKIDKELDLELLKSFKENFSLFKNEHKDSGKKNV
jgi:hypothetical protein